MHALWDGSEHTDLVAGPGIEFHDRGAHELRGVPGTWRLFKDTREHPTRSHPYGDDGSVLTALKAGARSYR